MPEEVPMKLTNESGEWLYVEYTAEEIAQRDLEMEAADLNFDGIRGQRDGLLLACDWTDLPNAPLTAEKVAEWATYRQELRDYPSQSDKVSTMPEWPTPPE
jgi:hypothetical protein